MHHFLPLERSLPNTLGYHNPEGDRQRGAAQPHPAALAGGLQAQSGGHPTGVGYCAESTRLGGEHPVSRASEGNSAALSTSTGGRAPSGSRFRFARSAPRLARFAALTLIRAYKFLLSPMLPPACRFYPTCSNYAYEAVEKYGVRRGVWLGLRRIVRCHPWGGQGYDPVPEWPKKSMRG